MNSPIFFLRLLSLFSTLKLDNSVTLFSRVVYIFWYRWDNSSFVFSNFSKFFFISFIFFSFLFKLSFILSISLEVLFTLDSIVLFSTSLWDKDFSNKVFFENKFWLLSSRLFNWEILDEILLWSERDNDLNSVICSLVNFDEDSSILVLRIFFISLISLVSVFCSESNDFFLFSFFFKSSLSWFATEMLLKISLSNFLISSSVILILFFFWSNSFCNCISSFIILSIFFLFLPNSFSFSFMSLISFFFSFSTFFISSVSPSKFSSQIDLIASCSANWYKYIFFIKFWILLILSL